MFPADQFFESLFESDLGGEVEHLFGFVDGGPTGLHVGYGSRFAILRNHTRLRDTNHKIAKLLEAGLNPRADVEDLIRNIAADSLEIGPGDIAHINEIHRLLTGAEDQRRLIG